MSEPLVFSLDDDEPTPGRRPIRRASQGAGPNWITIFTANLAALLLAGLLLGVAARAYLRWSIGDTLHQFNSEVGDGTGKARK